MASPAHNRLSLERELAIVTAERNEALEALRAILAGDADAVVIPGPAGRQVFAREGADRPYRVLFEAMHEGAALVNNGTIVYCNPRFASMVNQAPMHVRGASVHQYIAAEDDAAFQILMMRADQGGQAELTLTTANGLRVPTLASVCAITVRNTPTVCLILSDISALRDSEHRFRQLAETLPQLVWTCTPDRRCDYVSPQWTEFTGLTADATLDWTDPVHPDDQGRVAEAWAIAVAGGPAFRAEYRLRHADGTYRWVDGRGAALRDARGHRVKWFGLCIDIDDRIRIEDALRVRSAALERSNHELDQFASVASHDLQEPLRMVGSYTRLISERYSDRLDDDGREFLAFARDGAQRMQQLIVDLLAYARTGRQGVVDRVEPSAALADALANLQMAIADADAVVDAGPMPAVVVDAHQLVQVFQNLVGNALKFRGADRPRIDVSASPDGDLVHFAVTDNGIGIDPAGAQRIFGLFQRLHPRTAYAGTGLGLAICRKIVEQHGGRIWVASEPGLGSTFHFTLPADASTPHAAA